MKELKKPFGNEEFEDYVLRGMCTENSCNCYCPDGHSRNDSTDASVNDLSDEILF